MKLLAFLFVILIVFGISIAAEFTVEGDILHPVKTQVNDRLHVYRTVTTTETTVSTDALDVPTATKEKLNATFLEDMTAFIGRLRLRADALSLQVGNASSTLSTAEQQVIASNVRTINGLLDEAEVFLMDGSFPEAEEKVTAAVAVYVATKDGS